MRISDWSSDVCSSDLMMAMFMPSRGLGLLRASRPGVHIVRSLLMFLSTVCFFTALRWIGVPTATAINFTGPLIVTALAAPMLGEAVGPRRWAAVAVGFAGAMIIIRPGGAETHWAMLLVLGTATSYALYQIMTRKTSTADTPETSITYIAIVGAVLSSLVVPFAWLTPHPALPVGLFCLLGLIGGLRHYFTILPFHLGKAALPAPFPFAPADTPETSITYIAIVGAVLSSLVVPFDWVTPHSALHVVLFCLLGLIGGIGHYFIIRAFQLGEASLLAPFAYGQLIMVTILSWLVFGTLPDLWTFVGAGVIVASGLYITYRESRPKRSAGR